MIEPPEKDLPTIRIRIRVEQCIDSDDTWVWSLLDDYNGVICDGYSGSEKEAWEDAKQRRKEEIESLNTPED